MNELTAHTRDPNSLADLIRTIAEGDETAVDVIRDVTGPDGPDGKPTPNTRLVVERRKLQPEQPPEPKRAESKGRAHVFHDAAALAAYLVEYKTKKAVVLADVPGRAIHAILDETADNGREAVVCRPQTHPLFAPWADLIDDDPRSAAAFAEFVLANRRAVVEPDPKELVMVFSQIRASQKVEIRAGRGVKSINGVMVETEIQGEKKSEVVQLPDVLTIEVPLFVGTDPIKVEIDLLVGLTGQTVTVSANSSMVAVRELEAFEAMIQTLDDTEGLVVGLGRPEYVDWRYLR